MLKRKRAKTKKRKHVDSKFDKHMAKAEDIISRYRNTLHTLARGKT